MASCAQGPDEQLGAILGADQEDRNADPTFVFQAPLEARSLIIRYKKRGPPNIAIKMNQLITQERTRQRFEARPQEHDQEEEKNGQGCRTGDRHQVVERRVAPYPR